MREALQTFKQNKKTNNFLKRAAPMVVALFFILLISQISKALPAKTETYKDIIEKSYTLSLQKERTQAVTLLISAATRESKKGSIPKELLQAINEVATIFYSDKAQQSYELALSLRLADPILANTKLSEALKQDPENIQIKTEQVRMLLLANDCGVALKSANSLEEKYPYIASVSLLVAQSQVCLSQFAEYQKTKLKAEEFKNSNELFWKNLDLEIAVKQRQFVKAKEIFSTIIKIDPDFPETYFWGWKIAQEMKNHEDRSAGKYTSGCKSLSPRAVRKYLFEPRLCKRIAEIDQAAKTSAPEEETSVKTTSDLIDDKAKAKQEEP